MTIFRCCDFMLLTQHCVHVSPNCGVWILCSSVSYKAIDVISSEIVARSCFSHRISIAVAFDRFACTSLGAHNDSTVVVCIFYASSYLTRLPEWRTFHPTLPKCRPQLIYRTMITWTAGNERVGSMQNSGKHSSLYNIILCHIMEDGWNLQNMEHR